MVPTSLDRAAMASHRGLRGFDGRRVPRYGITLDVVSALCHMPQGYLHTPGYTGKHWLVQRVAHRWLELSKNQKSLGQRDVSLVMSSVSLIPQCCVLGCVFPYWEGYRKCRCA